MTRARAGALALLLWGAPGRARADLATDADTLAGRYGTGGARVAALPARVATTGASLALPIPEWGLGGAGGCTTVAVLGAVSTVFALRVAPPRLSDDVPPTYVPSAGGAAVISACGAKRADLGAVTVEMRSPRGVVETIVAASERSLPALATILPHRDPGAVPKLERPGPPPAPGTSALDDRAAAAEQGLRNEGAAVVTKRLLTASHAGSGRGVLDLDVGCHRMTLLGAGTPADGFRDLDAELGFVSGETVDVDRSDSPDAHLVACLGERRPGVLSFIGAAPDGPVVLLSGTSPLVGGVPAAFGPDGRAHISKALLVRRAPSPEAPPVFASLGVQGTTILPVGIEPGRCYLAVLGVVTGMAKLLSLAAAFGSVSAEARSSESDQAVAVLACNRTATTGTLEILAHGSTLSWGVAVFSLGSVRLGEEAP